MSSILRVAAYRFRTTFRREWGGYVGLMVLITLVGGLSMAALAGLDETDSSFPTYVAGTNPRQRKSSPRSMPLPSVSTRIQSIVEREDQAPTSR